MWDRPSSQAVESPSDVEEDVLLCWNEIAQTVLPLEALSVAETLGQNGDTLAAVRQLDTWNGEKSWPLSLLQFNFPDCGPGTPCWGQPDKLHRSGLQLHRMVSARHYRERYEILISIGCQNGHTLTHGRSVEHFWQNGMKWLVPKSDSQQHLLENSEVRRQFGVQHWARLALRLTIGRAQNGVIPYMS